MQLINLIYNWGKSYDVIIDFIGTNNEFIDYKNLSISSRKLITIDSFNKMKLNDIKSLIFIQETKNNSDKCKKY